MWQSSTKSFLLESQTMCLLSQRMWFLMKISVVKKKHVRWACHVNLSINWIKQKLRLWSQIKQIYHLFLNSRWTRKEKTENLDSKVTFTGQFDLFYKPLFIMSVILVSVKKLNKKWNDQNENKTQSRHVSMNEWRNVNCIQMNEYNIDSNKNKYFIIHGRCMKVHSIRSHRMREKQNHVRRRLEQKKI